MSQLRSGDYVVVRTILGKEFEGRFLAAGDEWVSVRISDGEIAHIPRNDLEVILQTKQAT